MDRDPIKKGFLLVWPQRCCIIRHCLLVSHMLIYTAWAVLRACADVLSATRSFDEEGRPPFISYVGHLSFFPAAPSPLWNRMFLHTLRMLGPGLAIFFCMTSVCVTRYPKSAMIDWVVTVGCACHGVRRADLMRADIVCMAAGVAPQRYSALEGGAGLS